jgi:hypothetical protein
VDELQISHRYVQLCWANEIAAESARACSLNKKPTPQRITVFNMSAIANAVSFEEI